MSAESDAQREITRIALAGIGPAGFALAGSGAVREHGLIDRPTEDVDPGVDWRERPPVTLDVGPVLSLADATGNKVSALFSRGAARDYLDVDAIRRAGAYSDEELVAAAAERDPGFDLAMFAHQLDAVRRATPTDVVRYGVSSEQLEQVPGAPGGPSSCAKSFEEPPALHQRTITTSPLLRPIVAETAPTTGPGPPAAWHAQHPHPST